MSSTPGSQTSWHRLPTEIRHQILQSLLGQDGCRQAPYATVSREWQAIVETHTFARIRLTPSRIDEFESMVHRNRALVRYIWLCLELMEYDCFMCAPMDPVLREFRNTDSYMIMVALLDVFSVLSTWEPQGSLQLDISVYSPSDSEHWFKYLTFEPDEPSNEYNRLRRRDLERSITHNCEDWQHGWRGGRRRFAPDRWAIHKIFNRFMGNGPFSEDEQEEEYWRQLPLAPAVKSVLLRQQNRRRWNPTALAGIFARLPGLLDVHYEPWREWSHAQQIPTDESMRSLLESLASSQVRRLILFENSCSQYLLDFPFLDTDRGSTLVVSRAIASASLVLEHLAASFMVDASDFFEAREPSWRWLNLTWLALTSRLLTPDQDAEKVDEMLCAAAAAAMTMPNLETMELWNGSEGLAMVFKYQRAREREPAVITTRGTWDFALCPEVVDAWEVVAKNHCCEGCTIEKELLNAAAVTSTGDAIHYLRLSHPVIRPISLEQIRMERGFVTECMP
ncbi:hypothetical protein BBK36DRAFT_1110106 [Trichoderma citrinoviride]|uniref:DUF6546 domain-containing protein n=1 Tax=Trichoderma citrinoviride TaxID=58853 RepID=A0A2T4BL10_9HYPO|nr:hypothetical protein BBK36DRAFT_1110106 [Trichoderma citrinoviride]PTB69996.1 hypothetical protein BBK36DRAFT_1110106 [Trichoderma citrinoviride]